MKTNRFDTLLAYVLKDLTFRSRVLVRGNWSPTQDIDPGSNLILTFYFERLYKNDIRQVEKLNNTKLLEDITLEMRVSHISVYNPMSRQQTDNRDWRRLNRYDIRNEFKFCWRLCHDQIPTLLDYILYPLNLPKECAVMVFGCKKRTLGWHYYSGENLDLLFVFPVVEKDWKHAINKLKGRKLLKDTNVRVHCLNLADYEKFLSGELPYFDEETRMTGMVLYDYFHRKRLNAEFIKKEKKGLPSGRAAAKR